MTVVVAITRQVELGIVCVARILGRSAMLIVRRDDA
jgi:hypothetical protein